MGFSVKLRANANKNKSFKKEFKKKARDVLEKF